MSNDFEDDEKPTPPRHRALTDSERQVFAAQWDSSHKGVVRGTFEDQEDTSPIDIFNRAPRAAASDIVNRLRNDPKQLIPFVGEFAEWVVGKIRERSSSEQEALKELRELLSRPPNGATRQLQEHVARLTVQAQGLSTAISELADRIEPIEKSTERVEEIEATIKSVKGLGWKAALAIVTTLVTSAAAIIATLQAKAEATGALNERVLTIQRDIAELKAAQHTDHRRDYDYDIAPRHQKKDNEP